MDIPYLEVAEVRLTSEEFATGRALVQETSVMGHKVLDQSWVYELLVVVGEDIVSGKHPGEAKPVADPTNQVFLSCWHFEHCDQSGSLAPAERWGVQ